MRAVLITLHFFGMGYFLNELSQIRYISPCIYGFDHAKSRARNTEARIIGSAVAAIIAPFVWIMFRMGKKNTLIVANLIMIIGSIINLFPYFILLVLGRVAKAISIIIICCTAPLLLRDIGGTEHRGPYLALINVFNSLGFLTCMFVGFLIPEIKIKLGLDYYCRITKFDDIGWRIVLSFPLILSVLQIIGLMCCFENQFNAKKVHKDYSIRSSLQTIENFDRRKDMKKFYSFRLEEEEEKNCSYSIYTGSHTVETSTHSIESDTESYQHIFSSKGIRPLVAGCLMHAFLHFSGVNLIFSYSYYYQLKIGPERLTWRLILALINFFMSFVGVYFAKIFRRKPVVLIATIIACALNCFLFQLFEDPKAEDERYKHVARTMSTVLVIVFAIVFTTTIGPFTWVYSAEILNDKGMCMAICVNWGLYTVISALPTIAIYIKSSPNPFTDGIENVGIFFFLFSGASMLLFFLIIVFARESKGLPRMLIERRFHDKSYNTVARTSTF
ncbi:unnamed protein product [Moneuplotes crassus]|uniref:Uncharacterized protein n=1 Tax=Euplotes crassus TaxID=5936 RepID=A0AAD1UHH4_EUPCR|nr:unnamed protein product [Moneuplotes crassus]